MLLWPSSLVKILYSTTKLTTVATKENMAASAGLFSAINLQFRVTRKS